MTHRDNELVERLFDTSVNPPGHKPGAAETEFDAEALAMIRKAPGIDEGGDEPHAGYRLGSPPSAQQAGRWKVPGDEQDEV